MDKETAYKLGYDCAKNGANDKNCNFCIFSKRENKDAWERGAEDYKDANYTDQDCEGGEVKK